MTVAHSVTRDLFLRAVETVRTWPLDDATRSPAFTFPRGTQPEPTAWPDGAPEPAGLPGDLWETAAGIASGRLDAADVIAASTAAIARYDQAYGVFESFAPGYDRLAPNATGPLRGIPVTVKDIIDVGGLATGGSSAAIGRHPAAQDATAVARLRAAGAAILGKVATHEFALGVTTPQSRSPWDTSRIPGGSSGGSAISLVTGMALGSLGTDTRASIRVPAALCGLVGFKPSFGTVPVDRWLTLSWSMDHFAPMARSVRDIAILMDILAVSGDTFRSALPGALPGTRLGWSPPLVDGVSPGVGAAFDAALETLSAAGALVTCLDTPSQDDLDVANSAGMVLSRAEAARFHAECGTDIDRCIAEVKVQLDEAGKLLATDYLRAAQLRGLLRERLAAVFDEVDLLVMPTTKVAAPLREAADDYLLVLSENCIPWSFVDFPAITLFAGMDGGLPVGIELVGAPGSDRRLLALAHAVEQALPRPPAWSPR